LTASPFIILSAQRPPFGGRCVFPVPGFAASPNRTIIGMGETVKVLGHEDIWVRVDAGGGDWWVPGWALRAL
jgi:hypothetical protein